MVLTITQVEKAFSREIAPELGRQYEWVSYPAHVAEERAREGREPEVWSQGDSPWNGSEIAEYNRHNGVIVEWWKPTIENDKISGWTKRPGRGHTLDIW